MKQQFSNLLLGLLCGAVITAPTFASSHREAPGILKYPQVDGTDFYMFNGYEAGREGYVTFIANYVPVQAAYGGPNYFPLDADAVYEIHIDNDANNMEDITFSFDMADVFDVKQVPVFGSMRSSILRNIGKIESGNRAGLSHAQTYNLTVISGDRRTGTRETVTIDGTTTTDFGVPFDYSGLKTFDIDNDGTPFPGGDTSQPSEYKTYADSFITNIDIPSCTAAGGDGRVFVGQRYEAFKLALGEIFDLVNTVPVVGFVTEDLNRNDLIRNNVTSIALEIHKDCLGIGANNIIGAWTTASLPQATIFNPSPTLGADEANGGALVQMSRLSNPLVNELVISYDQKDLFNRSIPADDAAVFLSSVQNPVLPFIVDSLFRDIVNGALGTTFTNIAPTNVGRADLVAAFLTGFTGVNANGSASEMLRLNTDVDPRPRETQQPLGVAAGDLAGFPNGRRPGDDVVDIALRVVMGALCHPIALDLDGSGTAGDAGDNLGLCAEGDAVVGNLPFSDGVNLDATQLDNSFPYLLTPYPGSPSNAPFPTAN